MNELDMILNPPWELAEAIEELPTREDQRDALHRLLKLRPGMQCAWHMDDCSLTYRPNGRCYGPEGLWYHARLKK